MKLRDRLVLAFSALVLVAAVGLGLGVLVVHQLSRLSGQMIAENLATIQTSAQLRNLVGSHHGALSQYLMDAENASPRALMELMSPFMDEARMLQEQLRQAARSDAQRMAVAEGEQALAGVAEATLQQVRASQWNSADPQAAAGLLEAVDQLRLATRLPYEANFEQLRERAQRVASDAARLGIALALLGGALMVVGLLAALLLARRLSRPLETVNQAMAQVGAGNYAVRLPAADIVEIDRVSDGFNGMVSALGRFHDMRLDEIVAERRRLDTVIDCIDHGLVIIDEAGRIDRLNPVAARQLSVRADELTGMPAAEVFEGSQLSTRIRDWLRRPGMTAVDELDGCDIEREVAGKVRTLAWTLTPYSDARRPGLLLMLRDVSQERAMEQLRTEFVLRAAHELRTPVAGMRMALGLLQDRVKAEAGSREAELLQTLGEEMDRTVQLIANLLDLARMYNHGLTLMPTPIDAAGLLRQAGGRFEEQARSEDVRIDLELPPGLPQIQADREQIDRVLDNLLSNALRHTPRGGRIGLRAHRMGHQLLLEVSDSGDGIADAMRERVFEPFVQVGRATGGTGIGLAMSREIAEQHGGRLRLEDARDGGCRFVLSLPI